MATVTSEWIVETAGSQSAIQDLIKTVQTYNERIGTLEDTNRKAFQQGAKDMVNFNRQLADGTKIYKQIENNAESFAAENKRLNQILVELTKRQKEFIAAGRYEELQQNIAGVKNRIKELDSEFEKGEKQIKKNATATGGFKDMIKGLGVEMLAMLSIGAFIALGQQIFSITAEFQKMEAVLTTSLGSGSAAERSMNMIRDIAAETPFSVQELTDSYVNLAGRGIRATREEMEKLGDVAASKGKSMDQFIEATLDAMSGENERLKEFGITAEKTGKTTQYTFQGVTTSVENTDTAIKEYLLSLGEMEGVVGSMAAISETLAGQTSNLGDTYDELFLTLGGQNTPVMGGFISFLNSALEGTIELMSTTEQLGQKLASQKVTDFAVDIEGRLKVVAEEAKASGQDVATALNDQTATLKTNLQNQLKEAQKAVDDFGIVQLWEKEDATKAQERLALIKGELAAIEDAKRFVQEDLNKKLNADAAKAEKEAAKAAEEAEKERAAEVKKIRSELAKELEALEKEAQKSKLGMMQKGTQEYAAEVFAQQKEEIAAIEDSIKAKGTALDKNFKLSEQQEKQLSALRNLALKEYYEAVKAITQKEEDELFKLREASDEKEIEAIRRNYDRQIEAAQEAGNKLLEQALKDAKARDLAATGLKQENRSLDYQEEFKTEETKLQLNQLEGVDPAELERMRQQAVLDVQIEFAEKRLQLLEGATDKESLLRKLQLQNELEGLKDLRDKAGEEPPFNLLDLLGVAEGDRAAVQEAFQEVAGFAADHVEQQLEIANQQLADRKEKVEEQQNELNTEIELNKLGFASNVETKRQELAEAKKLRDQALEDQKKAQKAQAAVETLQQTMSLVTTSTNIMKGFSLIPIVGQALGIAAVGAMWAAFLSSKARAASATKFEDGGVVGGRRHSQGGNKYRSMDGNDSIVEIEEGEFITNRKSAKKYREVLELINEDDEGGIAKLLAGTGVTMAKPKPESVKELQAVKHEYATVQASAGGFDYKEDIRGLKRELAAIRKNTTAKPEESRTETATHIIKKKGNTTTLIRKNG